MKLGNNVKYHNVFLEFDNGLYRHIPYIMSYCPLLMKNGNFYDVESLNQVFLIRTLSNLFTT